MVVVVLRIRSKNNEMQQGAKFDAGGAGDQKPDCHLEWPYDKRLHGIEYSYAGDWIDQVEVNFPRPDHSLAVLLYNR